MLIYNLSKRNITGYNIHKINSSTENPNLEILKPIIEILAEFQGSNPIAKYDFVLKNEDAEAYFITFVKYLTRTAEPNILKILCNTSTTDFPILKSLLKYSHHSDVMVRNATRISLMSIFQKSQNTDLEDRIFITLSYHINDILKHIKQIALDLEDSYVKSNGTALKNALLDYQEEFEYINDILGLNHKFKNILISKILNDFITPFIFAAIVDGQNEYISPISCRVGLCLLSKLLKSITDFHMKECIMKIILHEGAIPENVKLKHNQILNSLLFILLKRKTNINTLFILDIFYNLQIFIMATSTSGIQEFYQKTFFILMKLFKINYQSNPLMECLKLKQLMAIFQPLIQNTIPSDADRRKIKGLFFQDFENLYNEISTKIREKITIITDIIDDEYEEFTNIKLDCKRNLIYLNFFFEDHGVLNSINNDTKLELYHLFCFRHLYLVAKNEEEKILPIIKRREKIGNIKSIDNGLPCNKIISKTFYCNNHFLKMTDTQLLILQSTKNETEGIIIFNSCYKDIAWSINQHRILRLCDIANSNSNNLKMSRPFFIHIIFENMGDLEFVTDILSKAKENQIKTVKRKLEILKIAQKTSKSQY